jgi:hypothetical protein
LRSGISATVFAIPPQWRIASCMTQQFTMQSAAAVAGSDSAAIQVTTTNSFFTRVSELRPARRNARNIAIRPRGFAE